ncbi:CatB-related O-acetyltransferase [Pseudomonas corrugata]|uniref:acyltransferase n=1 Tax=Pseudomonas corrugata TaxID=47879 RepID=UPI00222E69F7|nr:CatB-related O-acetyltransferase [Pseudomonas corrugata]UZD97170.1 CatB-related O-acetyltransferase [Pseudomonas corrugata]
MKHWMIRLYTAFQLAFLYRFRSVGRQARLGRRLFVFPGKVTLGNHCYIGAGSYLDGDIIIGDHSMLANNVAIVGGDHVLNRPGVMMRDGGREAWLPTVLGRDVWIGHGAIILNGISVGDGAIVAAGSVVTKNVAPFSVVAGNPARHIKWRFDEAGQSMHFATTGGEHNGV